MVCGLSPIWTLPLTAVLVGVALVVRPIEARELARFMVVMAYADWLFVKRVGDSKQSRSSRKRGELLAGASVPSALLK